MAKPIKYATAKINKMDFIVEKKQQEKYNNGSFYPSNYWNEVKQEIENL
jgi:hypothetical protein